MHEPSVAARASDGETSERTSKPSASVGPAGDILTVHGLGIHFGGVVALSEVDLAVRRGEVFGLIGPNGAGKTTLFNCISRIYLPQEGSVQYNGRNLLRVPRHKISRLGIARTFQNIVLFPGMTVLENVMMGPQATNNQGFTRAALRLPGYRKAERALRAQATEALDYLGLGAEARRHPSDLAYGIQKRVELARALSARPRLLLLDEPAAGLNHTEVESFGELLRQVCRDFSLTVVLVEHHMSLVMALADHIVVLHGGRKIADGAPGDIQADQAVIEAYLGET